MNLNRILSGVLGLQLLLLALQYGQNDQVGMSAGKQLASQMMGQDELKGPIKGQALKAWLSDRGIQISTLSTQLGIGSEVIQQHIEDNSTVSSDVITRLNRALFVYKTEEIKIEKREVSKGLMPQTKVEAKLEAKRKTLEYKQGLTVHIKRIDQEWKVVSSADYLGKKDKIDAFLKKWGGLNRLLPIATNEIHHAKLHVSNTTYDRKVMIKVNGVNHTWYVGEGQRGAVHLRKSNDSTVYKVKDLSTWNDLPTDFKQYVELTYLKVDDVVMMDFKGPADRHLTLNKKDDLWDVQGIEKTLIDEGKIKNTLNNATHLVLNEVVGTQIENRFGFTEGTVVTLKNQAGQKWVYQVGAEEGDGLFVKDQDQSYVVKVASYKAKTLKTLIATDFIDPEKQKAIETKTVQPPIPEPSPSILEPNQPSPPPALPPQTPPHPAATSKSTTVSKPAVPQAPPPMPDSQPASVPIPTPAQ